MVIKVREILRHLELYTALFSSPMSIYHCTSRVCVCVFHYGHAICEYGLLRCASYVHSAATGRLGRHHGRGGARGRKEYRYTSKEEVEESLCLLKKTPILTPLQCFSTIFHGSQSLYVSQNGPNSAVSVVENIVRSSCIHHCSLHLRSYSHYSPQ